MALLKYLWYPLKQYGLLCLLFVTFGWIGYFIGDNLWIGFSLSNLCFLFVSLRIQSYQIVSLRIQFLETNFLQNAVIQPWFLSLKLSITIWRFHRNCQKNILRCYQPGGEFWAVGNFVPVWQCLRGSVDIAQPPPPTTFSSVAHTRHQRVGATNGKQYYMYRIV